MRLPNGYGSVIKLSGTRRRPYLVRKTIGYNAAGQGVYNTIGYYATREEALQALAAYNGQSTISSPGVTLAKIYQLWLPIQSRRVGQSAIEGYKTSYDHLRSILAIPLPNLKFRHIQECFDRMPVHYASKKKSRTLLNQLIRHAYINELIPNDPGYGRLLDIGQNIPVNPHHRFTRQQINKVWNCELPERDIVLLLLYTGMRMSELLHLKKADIKMRSKYFDIKQSKTRAGIRIIPIHDRILPIVTELMQSPGPYLLPDCRTYAKGAGRFNKVMRTLHIKHTSHDCRHTVRSILNEKDANPAAIDRLLGHHSSNIGDAVYTHVRLPQLRKTLRLLP